MTTSADGERALGRGAHHRVERGARQPEHRVADAFRIAQIADVDGDTRSAPIALTTSAGTLFIAPPSTSTWPSTRPAGR